MSTTEIIHLIVDTLTITILLITIIGLAIGIGVIKERNEILNDKYTKLQIFVEETLIDLNKRDYRIDKLTAGIEVRDKHIEILQGVKHQNLHE